MPDVSSPCRAVNFNAQHAPAGAFFSFTCGHFGTPGGFGIHLGRPGSQNLYIGVKHGGRRSDAPLRCLPFFEPPKTSGAAAFLVEQVGPAEQHGVPTVPTYPADEIRREYGWSTDRWVTPDFEIAIYTPFPDLPDPATAVPSVMADALCPAVVAELMVDNTRGDEPKTMFFALGVGDPGIRLLDRDAVGFAHRDGWGVRAEARDGAAAPTGDAFAFMRWTPDGGLRDANPFHMIGNCPGVGVVVPPGERRSLRLALGVHVAGEVTSGIVGRYFYTRFFASIESVLEHALARFDVAVADAMRQDAQLAGAPLNADQRFLIAHSTRSYYGSTQLLDVADEPLWIVNEGEYCMINTLDLAADQVFWELRRNPWVVRNLLDRFVRDYSYTDRVRARGDESTRPGGISFCHDMGIRNQFSPRGNSSYEIPHQDATCFSFMTAEQLCNWTLIAVSYLRRTGDRDWGRRSLPTLLACLKSLHNRGDGDGVPAFDSDRCGPLGAEITTYDSLDHSLTQTRNNLYVAVKFWAAHVGLAQSLTLLDEPARAAEAAERADRLAAAIPRFAGEDGAIPAILECDSGQPARILSAIECLIFPAEWAGGDESLPSGDPSCSEAARSLRASLGRHTLALLSDAAGRNLFPDGGLRLSSMSANSWMSKIALVQHVAREVLELTADERIAALFRRADAAHADWQTSAASAYWAMSDQMVNGSASGSRYYPRCVTAVVWMP